MVGFGKFSQTSFNVLSGDREFPRGLITDNRLIHICNWKGKEEGKRWRLGSAPGAFGDGAGSLGGGSQVIMALGDKGHGCIYQAFRNLQISRCFES